MNAEGAKKVTTTDLRKMLAISQKAIKHFENQAQRDSHYSVMNALKAEYEECGVIENELIGRGDSD